MTPAQALQILSQATEPGVKLTRQDYIIIQQALNTLELALNQQAEKPTDEKNAE